MRPDQDPVIEVEDLAVHYRLQGGALARLLGLETRTVKALDGVSLQLGRGEVLGVVGESGSGKSTLGRAMLGLAPATAGSIRYRGHDDAEAQLVSAMSPRALRGLRTDVQMVFQDPGAALNPSMTIERAVGDPLVVHGLASGAELRRRVHEALERVGLSPVERFASKLPADLSGGQKQRAVIARAIIMGPQVLVADEPISMLDMSVRAKILQLMLDLKSDLGLTYLYITHDLASAKYFCDRIAIMYLGRVVEIGPTAEIFAAPRHPYTQALLAAVPDPDPTRMLPRDLPRGEVPDAAEPPSGCAFHPRCPAAFAPCGWEARDLRDQLERYWAGSGLADYESDARVVGDLGAVGTHRDGGLRISTRDPDAAAALLDRARAADVTDPFWRGVTGWRTESDGVRIDLAPGQEPRLRVAPGGEGRVEVACHLHDPSVSHADTPGP
ncbi:ABC transporter ATP-binding protein [Nocardioides sp. R-C-SC26]|uniref:ABC transporter ATP-binding protein n=1 Tax=Nocardioides sp. R-C-SC26 TaxID=2870414 RepID=UPI001E5AE217|nr:ABC transporter ATP-binding protein [Nocardioides sp. R-C-SC26]